MTVDVSKWPAEARPDPADSDQSTPAHCRAATRWLYREHRVVLTYSDGGGGKVLWHHEDRTYQSLLEACDAAILDTSRAVRDNLTSPGASGANIRA